jgi:hypothetical protein
MARERKPPFNGFKNGQKKPEGSGRQSGRRNLLTKDMKEALLAAVDFSRAIVVLRYYRHHWLYLMLL